MVFCNFRVVALFVAIIVWLFSHCPRVLQLMQFPGHNFVAGDDYMASHRSVPAPGRPLCDATLAMPTSH